MFRRLLILPLAIVLITACSGGDDEPRVLGVAVESSTTSSTTASRASTSSTTETPQTTAAPASPTTTAAATAPAPTTTAPRPATTAPPPPTTAAPAPPATTPPATVQTVSGRYVSPDGDGTIEIQLHHATGGVVAQQATGPSGGDFSFAVDPGTYRVQISDAGPGPSANRTSGQVITRTESFTLEAGRSIRFECHVRTGCSGTPR